MLILCRKPGQRVWIGPDICVAVLKVGWPLVGDDRRTVPVELGFDAPPGVVIDREERRLHKLDLQDRQDVIFLSDEEREMVLRYREERAQ